MYHQPISPVGYAQGPGSQSIRDESGGVAPAMSVSSLGGGPGETELVPKGELQRLRDEVARCHAEIARHLPPWSLQSPTVLPTPY